MSSTVPNTKNPNRWAEMLIRVRVKPNSKREGVKRLTDVFYEVRVKEKPQKGKANQRLIDLLSEYFKVPKERVRIISGKTSRMKVVEVLWEHR